MAGGLSLEFSIRCICSVWQLQHRSWTHSRFTSPFGDLERFDLREFQNRLSPLWTDGMENGIRKWLVTPYMSGAGYKKEVRINSSGS